MRPRELRVRARATARSHSCVQIDDYSAQFDYCHVRARMMATIPVYRTWSDVCAYLLPMLAAARAARRTDVWPTTSGGSPAYAPDGGGGGGAAACSRYTPETTFSTLAYIFWVVRAGAVAVFGGGELLVRARPGDTCRAPARSCSPHLTTWTT